MGEKQNKKNRKFFTRLFEIMKSKIVIASVLTLIVFTILMFIIFISEQKTNSSINTLFDAIWYTLVTITTVGYGDITPHSILGRSSAMILLLAGVALFGALSGKFASFLFDRQQKKDKGLLKMNKMKNHFLICGWKPNFERILEGILLANPEIPPEKITLLNNSSQTEMEKIKVDSRFKNIHYITVLN